MKAFLKNNWKLILNLLTFGLLMLAIYLVRKDIGHALSDLGKINALALVLVIPLQVINYSCYAHLYQSFLKMFGHKLAFRELYKAALETNFVNMVLPSGGVSGFSYFAARLKPEGVSTSQSTLTHSMRFLITFSSYIALLFIGLFILALDGRASNMTILIACSLAFIILFGIIVGTYIISSKGRIHRFTQAAAKVVNKVIHYVRPHYPETISLKKVEKVFNEMHDNYELLKHNQKELSRPFYFGLLANITELATIYVVYIAYGTFVNPGAVIIAYALANFAGLISVLPGGLGVYEGLMAFVMVSAGVPAGLSISVTIMYRILTMGFSLPLGYYFYNQTLGKVSKKQVDASV